MKVEHIDIGTTAGKAEVMRLAAEGRRVALRGRHSGLPWDEMDLGDEALWNWGGTDYAIIAEPTGPDEMWVTFSSGGLVIATHAERPASLAQDGPNAKATTVRYVRADQ